MKKRELLSAIRAIILENESFPKGNVINRNIIDDAMEMQRIQVDAWFAAKEGQTFFDEWKFHITPNYMPSVRRVDPITGMDDIIRISVYHNDQYELLLTAFEEVPTQSAEGMMDNFISNEVLKWEVPMNDKLTETDIDNFIERLLDVVEEFVVAADKEYMKDRDGRY